VYPYLSDFSPGLAISASHYYPLSMRRFISVIRHLYPFFAWSI
jgi:hypothetical protein